MGSLERSPEVLHEVIRKVEQDGIKFVRFEVSDMSGVSRCMVVPTGEAFQQALYEGKAISLCTFSTDASFDDIRGTGFASDVGFPNGLYLPDPATYRPLPWLQNTALLLTEPSRCGAPVTSTLVTSPDANCSVWLRWVTRCCRPMSLSSTSWNPISTSRSMRETSCRV